MRASNGDRTGNFLLQPADGRVRTDCIRQRAGRHIAGHGHLEAAIAIAGIQAKVGRYISARTEGIGFAQQLSAAGGAFIDADTINAGACSRPIPAVDGPAGHVEGRVDSGPRPGYLGIHQRVAAALEIQVQFERPNR